MANILLTGGTGVVGQSLIKGLTEDGHHVIFTTRDTAKAELKLDENQIEPKMVSILESDFTGEKAVEKIAGNLGKRISCVVHNARSVEYLKMDEKGEVSAENFQMEFFMDVTFPYTLTNALISRSEPLRDIVFISSMYGVVGPTPSLYANFKQQSPINYGVAKAAQIHLTKELAIRLAEQKIRVNCISYGGIEGRVNAEFKARYAKLAPMGEMLSTSDLYPPLQYLINNPRLKTTGENIKVDGGWTLW